MLIETIKQIAINTVLSQKPVNVIYGTIINENPLKIKLNENIEIESDDLIPTEKIRNLKSGEKLILLSVQGGQQFLILDAIPMGD